MFAMTSRKKVARQISDASVRYEAAVKHKELFSLPFEAANNDRTRQIEGFVAAVSAACKSIVKELVLLHQVSLLDKAVLAPQKVGLIWLPAIIERPNERNVLIALEKVISAGFVAEFEKLLTSVVSSPKAYELAPGIALFGDNGKLRVTASRKFIANLNNE